MLRPFLNTPPPGWPFNDLEGLLQRAARNPDLQREFWDRLLECQLFVIGHVEGHTGIGSATIDAGRSLHLASVPYANSTATVAFTSSELLSCSITENQEWVALPARNLFEIVTDAAILLNPCGPYGKELTPTEIRMALGGYVVRSDHKIQVSRPTQVLMGQLAKEPPGLVDALAKCCRSLPSIDAAYISGICMIDAGEQQPHPLVGVDSADAPAAIDSMRSVLATSLPNTGLIVDFVDMRLPGAMATHLRAEGRRFYKRAPWFLHLFRR